MITTPAQTPVHTTPTAEMRRSPGSTVAVWRTSSRPGSAGPVHRIDREQVVVVVEGELSATIDGVAQVASAGDAVVLPAGSLRGLRNAGRSTLVTLTAAVPGSAARIDDGDPVVVPWSA